MISTRRVLSTVCLLAATISGLVAGQSAMQATVTINVNGLSVGDYFRPTGGALVSGFPSATTPYVRSPCPALNTLANHGYLPRDGKNITRAVLKQAIMAVYNIDNVVATTLTSAVPEVISLAYLSTHNVIEHDASLARADAYYNTDPAMLDATLWADLAARGAASGKLGVRELASARRDRMQRCSAKPTGCDFGVKQRALAFGEASLLLISLGGKNGDSIRLDHATSFFVDERIPADYKRPATPVNAVELAAMTAKIQALAVIS